MFTKADAIHGYRQDVLPELIAVNEVQGIPNYPLRLDAWNEYLNLLATWRVISALQHVNWTPPIFVSGNHD